MKVVIYNDTEHAFDRTHFGCQLVMLALRDLCAEHDMEVIGTIPLDDCRAREVDHSLLEAADLVLVNGEGSLNHDKRVDLLKIAKQYPCALINTVFDSNTRGLDCLKHFLYIAARESESELELLTWSVEAHLVPDVILCAGPLTRSRKRRGTKDIVVDHNSGVVTLQDYQLVVPEIQAAKTVLTGSFHAALVAVMFEKRVAMWGSDNPKLVGLSADAGLPLFPTKQDLAPDLAVRAGNRTYVEGGQSLIKEMFEHLTTLA